MSSEKVITEMETVQLPWAKTIELGEAEYDGGYKMIRLRIREGRRITDLELDAETATTLAEKLDTWAKANAPE